VAKRKKRAKAGEVNKAAEVRAYMAAHPEAKDREICEALAEKGSKITLNYPSIIRSKMKAKKQKRRPAGKRGPGRPPGTGGRKKKVARVGRPPKAAVPEGLDLDRLAAAADFAQLCGGTDNAIEALEAAQTIYEAMREAE